ncbi:MAG: squalene--hopene cyclase [Spirochaetota bacterium]|nr:squalene--hopene cyclase [Spirochaetota bacterium]
MDMIDDTLKRKSTKKKLKNLSLWKRNYFKERNFYIKKIDHFLYNSLKNEFYNTENLYYKDNFSNININSLQNVDRVRLEQTIKKGKDYLLSLRENDTYWNARLDSNAGLNAQYILLNYFLDIKSDPIRDPKIVNYIINNQSDDGSWNIYYGGPGHLSYSIFAYFALKIYGYSPNEPFMKKARDFILSQGGVMKANVECKFWLSLLDQYSWKGLPPMPVQILLVPNRFVFSIYNISYWCRTSLVPMSIIYNKKIVKRPPKEAYIDELYLDANEKSKIRFDGETSKLISLENILLQMTKAAKLLEKASPEILDKVAIKKARDWILQHQDESGDWGGIYPAIQYSIMALRVLGYTNDCPEVRKGLEALNRFQIETENEIMLSACTSPVWDTAWTTYALACCGNSFEHPVMNKAINWLYSQQIFREGDWSIKNQNVLPGGWCFQFYNDFYPDTDDTAVVLMAVLTSLVDEKHHEAFKLGVLWLLSMQNNDGGWGAFERNVDKEIMNYLPLNDLKNFLDQSTADVTGRILELLGKIGFTCNDPIIDRAIRFLLESQENFGAWYGRWGVNYIYGTWSVLRGLKNVGMNMKLPNIQKAVDWLKSCQNADGGWGESCHSYEDINYAGIGVSTASQTAWALMTLISANEETCVEVQKGINYLINTQNEMGGWDEIEYTGTGFERAFYLRYTYYPYYFPMLALGNYFRNTK